MPSKEFLEEYPLYRKYELTGLPGTTESLDKPSINMYCPACESNQTFVMTNSYAKNRGIALSPPQGRDYELRYKCTHCNEFYRLFFIVINEESLAMKIGQYPPWDIEPEKEVKDMLGAYNEYYKKGLICESQSYGIGAFSYYRRIVEEVIESLLDEIPDLMSGQEREKYEKALEETKKTKVTSEKIEFVKDLLPSILRPDNINPLSVLHSSLSEGIHDKSDEDCLKIAERVRESIVFLVYQVSMTGKASKRFTKGIRSLLEDKTSKD